MQTKQPCHSAIKWVGAAAGLTAAAYAAYAGITWLSYGHTKLLKRRGGDPLLDVFMPSYDVVERHSIGVEASPETTLAAATEMDVNKQFAIRAIFKGRELLLRSNPDHTVHPDRLLAAMQSFGWGVLPNCPAVRSFWAVRRDPGNPTPCSAPYRQTSSQRSMSLVTSRLHLRFARTMLVQVTRYSERRQGQSQRIPFRVVNSGDTGRCCRQASSLSAD